ncbi:MAG: DNA primase [Cytophagales bacterium]|nr:DNA primase [Cytophagales bacterium]
MLSKKSIDEIKERVAIEDVVKDYVPLKKSGHNFVCCCPFHKERTPSFFVFPKNNFFKCFGCGEAGDAITFIKKIENLDFSEALRLLGNKYGVKIEENIEHLDAEYKKKEEAIILLEDVKKYFCENLMKDDEVQNYLRERNINDDVINIFSLGYSLEDKQGLSNDLKNKKRDLKIAHSVGMLSCNEYKNIFYDKFRHRLMIPLKDHNGKTVGFAGRLIDSSSSEAKYINSHESFIYHKSNLLFGLYECKQFIRDGQNCYLVEGYFDVISLYQSGVKSAVASCGTSLTDRQCVLLRRFTDTVTVFYDSDVAGHKATERAIELLLKHDFIVNVVDYDEYKDPDEMAKKVADVVGFLKTHERDFISFLVKEKNDNITDKTHLLKDIKDLISLVKDDSYRSVLIAHVKKIFDISSLQVLKKQQDNVNTVVEEKINVFDAYEKDLLRLLLVYYDVNIDNGVSIASYMSGQLKDIVFTDIKNEEIKNMCLDFIAHDNLSIKNVLSQIDDDAVKRMIIDITTTQKTISDQWFSKFNMTIYNEKDDLLKSISSNIARYKLRLIHQDLCNKQKILMMVSADEMAVLIEEIKNLKKQEQGLARQLGITIV